MNFKEAFGGRYKVELDEAAEDGGVPKEDLLWYYEIPAKHGFFFPYDENKIAFWCTSNRIKNTLLRRFGLEVHQDGDDECTLLLTPDQFEAVAREAKARRKRKYKGKARAEKAEQLKGARKRKAELHPPKNRPPETTQPM